MYFSRPTSTTVNSAFAGAPGPQVAPRVLATRAASRWRRTAAADGSICAGSFACTADSNAFQATDLTSASGLPKPSDISLLAVQVAAAKPAASTAGMGVGEAGLDTGAAGPAEQAPATRSTAASTRGVGWPRRRARCPKLGSTALS